MTKKKCLKFSSVGLAVILALTTLIFAMPVAADVPDWTIDGDTVYTDDENVYLSATPHTLVGSGWVEFELISKKYEGEIDVAWGFDASAGVKPKNPQVWADNVPHEKERWIEVEREGSSTISNIMSYEVLVVGSAEPNLGNENNSKLVRLVIDEEEFGETSLVVAFNTHTQHNETSATFNYNYTSQEKEYYTEYYPDFKPFNISNFTRFTHSYLGVDDWSFVILDATIQKDITYKVRVWIDVPFTGLETSTSKYVWGVKPHNETLLEAKASGHLYLLDPWLSTGWDQRVKLTIDNTDIDTALSNFPILVYLSTSSGRNSEDISFIFDELENDANRKKIAVTTSDGETQCYVEIEKWDDANEQAWLWVKVPSVASGTDTDLYLYYDKDHADNDTYVGDTNSVVAESVWDADFVAVYHMADGADNQHIYDSTSNDNDGTKGTANEPLETSYQIDKGQDFEAGTTDYITCGTDASVKVTGALTLEVWHQPETIAAYSSPVGRWDTGAADRCYTLMMYTGSMYFYIDALGTWAAGQRAGVRVPITAGVNVYWAGVFRADGEQPELYKDAVESGIFMYKGPTTIHAGTTPLDLGCQRNNGATQRYLDGKSDEVRISKTDRSPAWVKASYESERDDLLDFGIEEYVTCYAPTDFTLTLSNGTIGVSWTLGAGAATTVVMRQAERYPTSVTDGVEAYNGAGTSFNDTGLNVEDNEYFYRAWSHNASGYSENYAEGIVGGVDMMLIALVILGGVLLGLAFAFKQMVLAFAAAFAFIGLLVIGWTSRVETYDIYGVIAIIGMVMVLVSFIMGYIIQRRAAEESTVKQMRLDREFPPPEELTEEEEYSRELDKELGPVRKQARQSRVRRRLMP